jgi:hypothetical protein
MEHRPAYSNQCSLFHPHSRSPPWFDKIRQYLFGNIGEGKLYAKVNELLQVTKSGRNPKDNETTYFTLA